MHKISSLLFVFLLIGIGILASSANAQRKRPAAKPAPKPAAKPDPQAPQPQATPLPKAKSPAEQLYVEGLKCPKEDYDCQVSNYTKAINLGLNTKEVYKNRGNAYLQRKDYDKAIADHTKLIELDPNDTTGYKNRGKLYLEISNSPQAVNAAIRDFTNAIDLEPKDVEALSLRSSAYLKLRAYDRAKADMDKIVAIEPKNVDVLIGQAEMFKENKQYDEAIEAFNKAVSLKPSASTYLGRGNAYSAQKKYDLAIADYSKAIELDPKNADAYDARGNIYLQSGKTDEGIEDINKAIQIDPNKGVLRATIAEILVRKAKYDDAIKIYNNLIALDPKNVNYLLKRADLNLNISLLNYGPVETDLATVIEINPQSAKAYELRCKMYRFRLKLDETIENCSKAIQLDPSLDDAYEYKSLATFLKTKNMAAYDAENRKTGELRIANATRILASDPNNYDAYYKRGLGNGYSGIQNYPAAIADFQRAIEIRPETMLAYSMLENAYVWGNGFTPAGLEAGKLAVIKMYSQAIEKNPTLADLWSARGEAYSEKMKDYVRSEQDHTKAIELDPTNASRYEGRAKNYARQKNFVKAEQDCQKAVDIEPLKGAACYLSISYASLAGSSSKSFEYKQKAESILKTAIELSPNNYDTYKQMGSVKLHFNSDPKYLEASKKSFEKGSMVSIEAYENAIPYFLKCNQLRVGACDVELWSIKAFVDLNSELIAEMKAFRAEQKARIWETILDSANAFLSGWNAGKQSNPTIQPNTTVAQTTQTAGTSNATTGSTSNNGNQHLKTGEILISDQVAESQREKPGDYSSSATDCLVQGYTQYKHQWSAWEPTPIDGLLWRNQGPIRDCGNYQNDEKGKISYSWYFAYKNTTNNIMWVECDQISADGSSVNTCGGLIAPGGVIKQIDAANHTFSDAPNVSFKLRYLETCPAVRISKETPYGTSSGWGCQ